MKRIHTIEYRKSGYALATVLAAIAVSTLVVVGVVNYSMQRAHTVRMLGDRAKAITYSESGLDYAYSKISTDFSLRYDQGSFPSVAYGEGSYEITLSDVTSNSVLVTCVGYCGSASNVSAISIRNYTETAAEDDHHDNSSEAWNYAILTGGELQWYGSGTFNGGGVKLHSGQAFLLTGSGYVNADIYSPSRISLSGNASLDGDANAQFIEDKKGNITGTSTLKTVDPISLPSIDLDPYYREAEANGQVYSGDQTWNISSSYSPPGGVIWVQGNLNITGQGVLNACVIATGEISSSMSGGITAYGTYPMMVSRDGNVKISSQGDYTGLLYVPSGEFQMSGSGTITGQIMVAGNMSKSGCSSAFNFVPSAPTPPGGSESEDQDLIGISAWEK